MIIRDAEEKDIPIWATMRLALWPDPDNVNAQELQDYFTKQSPDIQQAYIAELNHKVIGFMELNIRSIAEGSRKPPVAYVEAWYIHPDYQGRGYGKQLMQKAEQWAKSKGLSELASDAKIENQNSIEVHQYLGFQEVDRIVCFIKQLN